MILAIEVSRNSLYLFTQYALRVVVDDNSRGEREVLLSVVIAMESKGQ